MWDTKISNMGFLARTKSCLGGSLKKKNAVPRKLSQQIKNRFVKYRAVTALCKNPPRRQLVAFIPKIRSILQRHLTSEPWRRVTCGQNFFNMDEILSGIEKLNQDLRRTQLQITNGIKQLSHAGTLSTTNQSFLLLAEGNFLRLK